MGTRSLSQIQFPKRQCLEWNFPCMIFSEFFPNTFAPNGQDPRLGKIILCVFSAIFKNSKCFNGNVLHFVYQDQLQENLGFMGKLNFSTQCTNFQYYICKLQSIKIESNVPQKIRLFAWKYDPSRGIKILYIICC